MTAQETMGKRVYVELLTHQRHLETACAGTAVQHNVCVLHSGNAHYGPKDVNEDKGWSHSGTACLLAMVVAGCATGERLPKWETQEVMAPRAAQPPKPAVAPEPPRTLTRTNEPMRVNARAEAWIPLVQWCKTNGVSAPSRLSVAPPPAYELSTSNGVFVLRTGSRLGHWDGMEVWFGFAPQVSDGQLCIHALDLKKTMRPLLVPATPTFRRPHPTIVLDPGHGGDDAGTRSLQADRWEKDFTLDWARRLKPLLAARGWEVLLTRNRDMNLSLPDRVAFAETNKADLFLSLHFNSSAPDRAQGGAETYCLTPAGLPSSVTRGFDDSTTTVFPNNAFDEQNLQFACRVQRALLRVNGNRDRGVRRARYLGVLRGQNRPAILVEGGYLSNPREARMIADPAYRQRLAEAVATSLGEWAEIPNPKPEAPSQRAGGGSQETRVFSPTNSSP